jgi:hypothetical protein
VETWLGNAGAATGSTPATTAQLDSLDWNPLNGFGIPGTIAGAVSGAVGSAASSAASAIATPIEHFVAKALLVLVGLGVAGYGVISLVSPGHKPATEVLDEVGGSGVTAGGGGGAGADLGELAAA